MLAIIPSKPGISTSAATSPPKNGSKTIGVRMLSMEEIKHYKKVIVALMETDRVMEEVDGVYDMNTLK